MREARAVLQRCVLLGGGKIFYSLHLFQIQGERMTAPAAVQRNSASVETEIRSLVMKRASIESQHNRLKTRLLDIDAEMETLKPRHFDGDANAAAAIEKLQTEKRDLVLRVEGAEAHIRKFDEQIKPLRTELRDLKELDVADETRRRSAEFEAKLEELVSARISTYRAACRALYQEAEFVHSEINLKNPLDSPERTSRLQVLERVHNRLAAVNLEVISGRWKSGPAFSQGPLTALVVKLPPENKNGLH
jgi:chromosome segregation ATPase